MEKKIGQMGDVYQILIGDFNTTLDPCMDRVNYRTDGHKLSRTIINTWLSSELYVDTYRQLNPNIRDYTWQSDRDKTQLGRLDYCLVTPNLMEHVVNLEHTATNYSAHCTITLELETNTDRKGLGTFRAQPGVENDIEYQS